jgi:hypothetical protein
VRVRTLDLDSEVVGLSCVGNNGRVLRGDRCCNTGGVRHACFTRRKDPDDICIREVQYDIRIGENFDTAPVTIVLPEIMVEFETAV